jgi:hypothetical protein
MYITMYDVDSNRCNVYTDKQFNDMRTLAFSQLKVPKP